MFEELTPWDRLQILETQQQDTFQLISQMANNAQELAHGLSIQQKHLVEVNRALLQIRESLEEINNG